MDKRIKTYLYDIKTAIDEIDSFFENIPRRYEEYCRNLLLRRAIERNIGIIGEAVNKISKEHPDIEISKAREIIATRNRVIHAYDAITDDIIWKIVIKDLPTLKSETESLLDKG